MKSLLLASTVLGLVVALPQITILPPGGNSAAALTTSANIFTATPQTISNATNPALVINNTGGSAYWIAMCNSLSDRVSFGLNSTVCTSPSLQIKDGGSGNAELRAPGGVLNLNSNIVGIGNVLYLNNSQTTSRITTAGDSTIVVQNSAGNGFTRFIFGSNDTSGVAFTKSSTKLKAQLGDGSADADLQSRHAIAGGSAPTIDSGFGTGATIAGRDDASTVTIGTAPGATGVITFNAAYTNAPVCVALANTGGTGTTTVLDIATTTTTATITASMTAADKIYTICKGY